MIGGEDLFAVEIVAYTGSGTETLRYATRAFTTGPNETVPNTYYDGRVKQGIRISRTAFASRATRGRSTVSTGEIELYNGDGALDNFLRYGFDGRLVTVRRGPRNVGKITSRSGTWTSSGVTLSATTARVNDGDTATNAWHTDSAVPGAYVQVDYGVPVTFSRLRMFKATAGVYAGTYKVRGSPDGSTWTDITTGFTPSTNGWNEVNFNPANYRYWRAELTNTPGAGSFLTEAEFSRWLTTVMVGTMQNPDVTPDLVLIKLRDLPQEMAVPVQTTKYAGSGTLEGGDDLTGKPKPLCFGKVLNVAPPMVDSTKLIFQVHDGALASLDAVRDRGVALVSQVGPSWTHITAARIGGGTVAIEYFAHVGLFIAVGLNAAVDGHRISTSPDGETWTFRALPISVANFMVSAVGFYGNLCVVGGVSTGTTDCRFFWSSDGVVWKESTSDQMGNSRPNAIVVGPAEGAAGADRWLAVGAAAQINTSDDNGVTWVDRTPAGFAGADDIKCAAYGEGQFVVAGGSGKLETSPDGVTWTARTSGFGVLSVMGVTYSAALDLWVICGPGGSISTSPDAITWTARTSGFGVYTVAGVRWIPELALFMAYGETATTLKLATSPDGVTWTDYSTGMSAGIFLASGSNPIAYNTSSGVTILATSTGVYRSEPFSRAYASQADLLDDTLAPAPGAAGVYLAGGYFRLGATPSGLVTCDATEGVTTADRTVAQLYKRLLVRKGKSTSEYSTTDVTALDSAANYVAGDWFFGEESYAAVFDRLVESVGASWYVDRSGVYRIKQLVAPPSSSVLDLVANDLKRKLQVVSSNDIGQGLPSYKTILHYQKNYVVMSTDLAASVSTTTRVFLSNEWREKVSTDAAVQTRFLLALQSTVDSLLNSAANAATEVARVQTLRGVQRRLFELVVDFNDETQNVDLFDTLKVTHSRYNLSGGMYATVLGIADDGQGRERVLTVWGAAP